MAFKPPLRRTRVKTLLNYKTTLRIASVFIMLMMGSQTIMADTIGYIDMEKLFASYKEGKKIQSDLQQKREEYQRMVEDRQKQVEAAKTAKKSEKDVQDLISKFKADWWLKLKSSPKCWPSVTASMSSWIAER
jgi:Skp family chaperone for outer membrane proteins